MRRGPVDTPEEVKEGELGRSVSRGPEVMQLPWRRQKKTGSAGDGTEVVQIEVEAQKTTKTTEEMGPRRRGWRWSRKRRQMYALWVPGDAD